jgi:hypothetical protein
MPRRYRSPSADPHASDGSNLPPCRSLVPTCPANHNRTECVTVSLDQMRIEVDRRRAPRLGAKECSRDGRRWQLRTGLRTSRPTPGTQISLVLAVMRAHSTLMPSGPIRTAGPPSPPPAGPIPGLDGQTGGRRRTLGQAGRAFEGVDRGHLVVLPRQMRFAPTISGRSLRLAPSGSGGSRANGYRLLSVRGGSTR